MKAIPAVLAALVLLAENACAIPQTFGNGNGFLNAAGVTFDQYVTSADPWAAGAELKGPWRVPGKLVKTDAAEMFLLSTDATVFGIPAAQISAERVAGAVRRFTVIFDERKQRNAKAHSGGLYDQVLANLTALAGAAKSVAPDGVKTFRHGSSHITVQRSVGNEVIVEFTPAR
jgi:hypothetical protein